MKLKSEIKTSIDNMKIIYIVTKCAEPKFFNSLIVNHGEDPIKVGRIIMSSSIDAIMYQNIITAYNRYIDLMVFT